MKDKKKRVKEKVVNPTLDYADLSIEDKGKVLDVELKLLQVQEKKTLLEGKFELVKVTNEVDKITIDKINCLKNLMITDYVDEDQPLFTDKYVFKQAFDDIDKGIIKQKIFELIKKM